MAVDTRDKRASALQAFRPGVWLFPNPDGSLATAVDRLHMGHAYAVELEASAVPAGKICVLSGSISGPYATGAMNSPYATGAMNSPYATGEMEC